MSTMTAGKSKKKNKPSKKASSAQAAKATFTRESEAPDRGAYRFHNEAPDSGRLPEAPDAGDGRPGYIESEFTHGRSQS